MMAIDQPYIPGFKNHHPPYTYRIGATYASQTKKALVEPATTLREDLILPNRLTDDFTVYRKCLREIDVVRSRYMYQNPPYKHAAPGFEGLLPKQHGRYGQRARVEAMEGLSPLQKMQSQNIQATQAVKNRMPKALEFNQSKWISDIEQRSDFSMPLQVVRPEMMGVVTTVPVCEPCLPPPTYDVHPFFMGRERPDFGKEKYKPYEFPKFSEGHPNIIPMAMVEFTNNYQYRRGEQWCPIGEAGVSFIGGGADGYPIYHRSLGQLPGYMGHIPGNNIRVGKTFGKNSIDGKRWLRGDYSN
ncbi:UPF0605 protein GA14893-like [Ctenocephalides felis]|uniref:UPF0605 protein GA14893-like n=1 Tax=Ctenocephalides felis TaxID=7515 RepID=UPI000E6E15ED|nr:UPF0605 protein GA14893-like [Ctenocephalides felis]